MEESPESEPEGSPGGPGDGTRSDDVGRVAGGSPRDDGDGGGDAAESSDRDTLGAKLLLVATPFLFLLLLGLLEWCA